MAPQKPSPFSITEPSTKRADPQGPADAILQRPGDGGLKGAGADQSQQVAESFHKEGHDTLPPNQAKAQEASNFAKANDVYKSGNQNLDQVTVQSKNGSTEQYAKVTDSNGTAFVNKNGDHFTAKEGTNGQIELTPKNPNLEPVSGRVTGSGEGSAFGNKSSGNQTEATEHQTPASQVKETSATSSQAADINKESASAQARQQVADSQTGSRPEAAAKTGQESFKSESQGTQAKYDASSATTSPTKAGGDGSGTGSSQSFDQKPASSDSHISSTTTPSTSVSRLDSGNYGTTADRTSQSAADKLQEAKTQNTSAQDARPADMAGKATNATQAENPIRPESTIKNPGDSTTKPGITDQQTTHGQNANTRTPDAVAAQQQTLLPGKEGAASGQGGGGGSDIGGARGVKTGGDSGGATPGTSGGAHGGTAIDSKAGDSKPGAGAPQGNASGDTRPGTASDTTRTIKPGEPAEAPKATKAPEGASVAPTGAGKVESTGERTTGQPTEKGQTPSEKTSSFPAVDMSQKDTRKDVLEALLQKLPKFLNCEQLFDSRPQWRPAKDVGKAQGSLCSRGRI
jgi:hypothetical protein